MAENPSPARASSPASAPSPRRAPPRTPLGRACARPRRDPPGRAPADGRLPDPARRRGRGRLAPEHDYRSPTATASRAIDFALKAAEEAMRDCGVGVGPSAARALGRGDRHLQRRAAGGEEWYRRRLEGRAADPRLLLLVEPQAISEALARRVRHQGPGALREHRLRRGRERDRLRRRADPLRPGGRRPDRRRRRLLGHPVRGLQLARVALARARGAVLDRPQGALARRGQRDARPDARGRRARAGRADPRRGRSATACRPTATTRPRRTPRARAPRARSRRPAPGRRRAERGATTSTATARARRRTTPPRPRPRRSASARTADKVAVASTKSMIGHLLGGAGRGRGDRHRQGDRGPGRAADGELHRARPRVRPRLRPQRGARDDDRRRALEQLRVRRRERVRPVRAPGRAPRPPTPGRPRRDHRARGAHPAGTDLDALWEAYREGATAPERGRRERGRVDFDPGDFLTPKERKRMDRLGLFSVIGSRSRSRTPASS